MIQQRDAKLVARLRSQTALHPYLSCSGPLTPKLPPSLGVVAMAKLFITMYKPEAGNFEHWALYLKKDDKGTIFEVIGSHPEFKRNVLNNARPENTVRFRRSVLVATIRENDVAQLVTIMEKQPVDNETTEWNCQDYVVEAVDKLAEECVIDPDDKDFLKGRKMAVDEYYGAEI